MSRKPIWLLTYSGLNVTDDIVPFVLSVSYTDNVEGESDEIEIRLDDTDSRWRELWYPSEGDRVELSIGYQGEQLLPCGEFTLDEVELQHSARVATVRGLAVPTDGGMRTPESIAYEDVSLSDVIHAVAARYDLQVLADDIEDLHFTRITQAEENSLEFLRRLGKTYGYAFSVRGQYLCFYRLLNLEAQDPVLTLLRTDLKSGSSFKGSAQDTYVACEVSYLDPITGQTMISRVEADGIRRGTTLPQPVDGTGGQPVAPDVVLRRDSPLTEEVRDWQSFLHAREMYDYAIDGLFGPITEAGTRQFQSGAGLEADGVVGANTYAAAIAQGFLSQTGSVGGVPAVGDVLRAQVHVESAAEAEAQARAMLHEANRLRVTGTMQLEGNQFCSAGITVSVPDMGRLSGTYLVNKSSHTMTRGQGYRTSAEVSHV